MIKIKLVDGLGRGKLAEVTSYNALSVARCCPDVPEPGTPNRRRFFSELLGSTGAGSGITDQSVNGAVTSQEFYIGSHIDYDIHIMDIVVLIADSLVFHKTFGNIAALATGWDLKFVESGDSSFIIEKAKTGGEVIYRSGMHHPYGNAATSFELTDINVANNDATTVVIPVGYYVPDGLRIGRGTKDKLISVVNDDLTGLVNFYVRALGYRHYP